MFRMFRMFGIFRMFRMFRTRAPTSLVHCPRLPKPTRGPRMSENGMDLAFGAHAWVFLRLLKKRASPSAFATETWV